MPLYCSRMLSPVSRSVSASVHPLLCLLALSFAPHSVLLCLGPGWAPHDQQAGCREAACRCSGVSALAAAAIDEMEYLGPEPDRWRGANEPELSAAQAPEHFIDLELADMVGKLPRRRYDYIAALYAAGLTHPNEAKELRPEKVGLQPWVTTEVYERLQAALREYRDQKAKGEDTKPVEAAAIFYAGWLGHYVGDGSMPLAHDCQLQRVGRRRRTPTATSRTPGIHSQFESGFVHRNMKASDVAPLMVSSEAARAIRSTTTSPTCAHRTGWWSRSIRSRRRQGFEGAGNAESKQFVASRLAAGASELRDMIATAWEQSAKPAPPYHEGKADSSLDCAAIRVTATEGYSCVPSQRARQQRHPGALPWHCQGGVVRSKRQPRVHSRVPQVSLLRPGFHAANIL